MPKKSKGRRKIEMAKMQKKSNLMVTFSKRRPGLFKKASELSILCGVEVAIIVFSPGEKVFSFGHPNVETIVDRFLTQNPHPHSSTSQLVEAHRNAYIYELNRELTFSLSQLELEKNKSEELTNIRKEGRDNHWWEAPIESLGLQELEQLLEGMKLLQNNIEEQKARIMAANPLPIVPVSGHNGIGGDYNQVMGYGPVTTMTPHGGLMPGYGHFSG